MSEIQNILLAVDAVVFGYTPVEGLSVLLVQRRFDPHQGMWALPGGFVREGESLEAAVSRELKEETGIEIGYLEQLYTFGNPRRDPRRRVVSVAYFALVRPETFQLSASSDASDVRWFDVQKLPDLAFDHGHILATAIERVRSKITYEPIGFNLLEEKFTIPELLRLYETILGDKRNLDRGNFKKKIKSLGLIEEVNEQRKQPGSGRPARLYRFTLSQYAEKKAQRIFEVLFPQSPKR
ncbi:MAG: NUDIX domain-containing protein [Bacteroidia bacterium]|nr:NUDIX domain-containing protein [Bacteroidia bacterium]